ncbi:hypothetical protein H1R20_g9996, partial [Candolleomyces eurysporus]
MVKFAVPIFVAALLATSAVASSLVEVNDFESRDAAEYEELFERCIRNKANSASWSPHKHCAKAIRHQAIREIEDNELEARDFEEFDELTTRGLELLNDVEELLGRMQEGLRA